MESILERAVSGFDGTEDNSYVKNLDSVGQTIGNPDEYNFSYAVRPIITLNPGILNGKTEEGTSSNPINLD